MQILISINQILTLKFRNDIFCTNAIDCLIKKIMLLCTVLDFEHKQGSNFEELHKQITLFKNWLGGTDYKTRSIYYLLIRTIINIDSTNAICKNGFLIPR